MSRIRTIKPTLFKHEALFDAEAKTGLPLRLAFIGLWTQCDREGRFAWRPRQLKTDVLPYDDCDFASVLDALCDAGLVVRYVVNGVTYGCVPSWKKHQFVNVRELKSEIPEPPETQPDTLRNIPAPSENVHALSGTGREEGNREQEGKNADDVRASATISKAQEDILHIAAGDSLNPTSPSLFSMAEPIRWLSQGMDFEQDVVPGVRWAATKCKPRSVRSWAYFSQAVADHHATRTAPMPVGNVRGPPPRKASMGSRMTAVLDQL